MDIDVRALRKEFEDRLIQLSGVSRQYANAASFTVDLGPAPGKRSTAADQADQYARKYLSKLSE
jgi:hypothetical protein